jgi:hypothetical protein
MCLADGGDVVGSGCAAIWRGIESFRLFKNTPVKPVGLKMVSIWSQSGFRPILISKSARPIEAGNPLCYSVALREVPVLRP